MLCLFAKLFSHKVWLIFCSFQSGSLQQLCSTICSGCEETDGTGSTLLRKATGPSGLYSSDVRPQCIRCQLRNVENPFRKKAPQKTFFVYFLFILFICAVIDCSYKIAMSYEMDRQLQELSQTALVRYYLTSQRTPEFN